MNKKMFCTGDSDIDTHFHLQKEFTYSNLNSLMADVFHKL